MKALTPVYFGYWEVVAVAVVVLGEYFAVPADASYPEVVVQVARHPFAYTFPCAEDFVGVQPTKFIYTKDSKWFVNNFFN